MYQEYVRSFSFEGTAMSLNTKQIPYKSEMIRDKNKIKTLLKDKGVNYVDAFSHQLKELFVIQNHKYIGVPKGDVWQTQDFKNFCNKNENKAVYVYYSWNHSLVKTFPKAEYLELKTNRNRNLITEKEQNILRNSRIGVFGMSVGSNIAFVLTQAGISNDLVIADFDLLDTTNLNRILAGVHEIGLPKVVVASRRIYEDNPFANVTIMPKGVDVKNLEDLLKKKKLDVIIEEIDEINMKIETRRLAIKYKIPVVMITDNGDGVVLHIERYDLGYKKIFDKDLKYWDKLLKQGMTRELAGKIIMHDIVGGPHKVDPNMLKSVQLVLQKKLVSWSQLGSAAILGGVVATVAIKNILLKKDKKKYVVRHIFV